MIVAWSKKSQARRKNSPDGGHVNTPVAVDAGIVSVVCILLFSQEFSMLECDQVIPYS